jgi:anti-sigma B factor antagonist
MELSVMSRREGTRTVISVTGEIDVYTAPTLRERLNDLVSQGEYDLVVDMAGVEFLDSTGLGVLVGGLKRARSHQGTLRLVCDQEKIIKVFRITGLTKVFPIYASLDDALTAVDQPAAAGRASDRPDPAGRDGLDPGGLA